MQRIEGKRGLRFGDRSQFYILLEIAFNEHLTMSHQPFLMTLAECKGITKIRNDQII